MPLVALAEIVGGILLIVPRTRAFGVLILFPIVVGILCTHIFSVPDGLAMALGIAAIFGWIIFENRNRFLHLIR